MSGHENDPNQPNDYRNDLVGLLRALFKRKFLVIGGVLLFTVAALILSLVVSKTYRSEGFYQFSDPTRDTHNQLFSMASQLLESSRQVVLSQLKDLGMLNVLKDLNIEITEPENFHVVTIQQFKKYSSAYGNYQEFLSFVKRNKLLTGEEFDAFKGSIRTAGQFTKLTDEIYALSRDDLKNVGQTLMQEKNYVVGVELQVDANKPETTKKFLDALGAFIKFSIFSEKFSEYITTNLSESELLTSRYDNYILANRSALEQLRLKKEGLLALYKKYPDFAKSGNTGNHQVVELGDNGQRYLSLNAQLIGVESRIIDIERLLESLEIERERSILYGKFFAILKEKLNRPHGSIGQIMETVSLAKTAFFKAKDMTEPANRMLSNTLDIDVKRFTTLHTKTLRFVAGPSLPTIPEWPRKSVFLIIGFFLGLLVFVSLALFLEFWSKYKAIITDGK